MSLSPDHANLHDMRIVWQSDPRWLIVAKGMAVVGAVVSSASAFGVAIGAASGHTGPMILLGALSCGAAVLTVLLLDATCRSICVVGRNLVIVSLLRRRRVPIDRVRSAGGVRVRANSVALVLKDAAGRRLHWPINMPPMDAAEVTKRLDSIRADGTACIV